jgi:hypothetical protein
MKVLKVNSKMRVLFSQLNAHNERSVYDVDIAYSITCTHWMMVSWCKYYIHNYMDMVKDCLWCKYYIIFIPITNCHWKCIHICNSFILSENYTSTMENGTNFFGIMSWASFYKHFMGTNVTKWSYGKTITKMYVLK